MYLICPPIVYTACVECVGINSIYVFINDAMQ